MGVAAGVPGARYSKLISANVFLGGGAMDRLVLGRCLIPVIATFTFAVLIGDVHARGIRIHWGAAVARGMAHAGSRTYGQDVLNQDQLEKCLKIERCININADKIEFESENLKQLERDLNDFSNNLKRQYLLVDRYNSSSVDFYNNSVAKQKMMVADYNSRILPNNTLVQNHNKNIDDFNSSCANKKYYEVDMQAARQSVAKMP